MHLVFQAEKILWPPSRERSSFNSRTEKISWDTVEASTIYDIDHIQSFAKSVPILSLPVARADGVVAVGWVSKS